MKFQSKVLLEGEVIREMVKLSMKLGLIRGARGFRLIAMIGGAISAGLELCCLFIFGWNFINFLGFLIGAGLLVFGASEGLTGMFFAWLIGRKAGFGERTYTYYDDRIESMRNDSQTQFPYDAIRSIFSYHDCFYLFIEAEQTRAIVHPKECFTFGTAGDFEKFIQEKTGKTVEYIR